MKKLQILFASLLAFSALAFALDLELAWIFTDHAVLQRELSIPVWGSTVPNATITAEINGVMACTHSSRTGEFMVRLPKLPAGGPYVLTVTAKDAKGTTATVSCQDVMVGDVWIAGGQSNMQYLLGSDWSKDSKLPLEKKAHKVNVIQRNEYLANCTPEATIRAISVPLKASFAPEDKVYAVWNLMDKQHADALSAVAAWFGRDIQLSTGVPVGIISCNWGGTRAESWMSRAALLGNDKTNYKVAERDAYFYQIENSMLTEEQEKLNYIEANHLADPGNKGVEQGWAKSDFDDTAWVDFEVPGSWMVQKIMGNGALWARKAIQIPENWVGKELVLKLGGIDKHDITYVNGTEVGRTGKGYEEQYWDTPREYPIPAAVNNSTNLVIAIRAFSFLFDGSFNGANSFFCLVLKETGERISLVGKWKAKPEVDFGGPFRFNSPKRLNGNNPHTPGILFDSMLRPIIPYGIRGAIWYQGEANASGREEAIAYRSVLASMIKDWRYQWAQGNFPFVQVQLAAYTQAVPYSDFHSWPYLRESQLKVCEDLPNVYLATAIDIGEADDIHPQNKKEVGRRLAETVLHHVYGKQEIVPFGPIYKGCAIEGNAIRLSFTNAKGLYFKDGTAKGFYIAGWDMKFVFADDVTIDGETIVVKARGLAIPPVAVRYAWSNNPDGNLYNEANLPASSFRTDK